MQSEMLTDNDLRLRPVDFEKDIGTAELWYRDPEVIYFSEGDNVDPYDRDTILSMYKYLSTIGELYIIEVCSNGGWIAIGDVALCPDTIPIVIGDGNFRSKGIGKRVLNLLMHRARRLGWTKLSVKKIFSYNERSIRLFQSRGFARFKTGRDEAGRLIYSYELDIT